MLQTIDLSKSYGANLLFEKVSLNLNPGEKAGLVGINGSGKTTLLRMIAGIEPADSGTILLSPGEIIGYLPQTMEPFLDESLKKILDSDLLDLADNKDNNHNLGNEIHPTTTGVPGADSSLKLHLADHIRQAALRSGHRDAGINRILDIFDLQLLNLDQPMGTLSGGQKIKVAIARLLLRNPSLLLLDEPTNNLDIPSLLWLEKYLAGFPGAVLVVSHDRKFLDRIVTKIFDLDEYRQTIVTYHGNYTEYIQQKSAARQKWEETYKDQQYEIRKMEQDIRKTKSQAQKTEKETNDSTTRRLARKVAKKAKARQHRLERYLESSEHVEKPDLEWGLKLDLTGVLPASAGVLRVKGLDYSYGDNAVLRGVDLEIRGKDRIAIVGRNGSGKSTLLKLLVNQLVLQSGSIWLNSSVILGYLSQEQTELHLQNTVLDEFRYGVVMSESEARRFLSYFLFFNDEPLKKVSELSLGERAKLGFAKIVAGQSNFIILDEPINHMDDRSIGVIELALKNFRGAILVVSHDRYFIDSIGVNKIYALDSKQLIGPLVGGYEDYFSTPKLQA